MPLYEYICRECKVDFEAIVGSDKRDVGTACPKCGAVKVARKISLMANPVVKSGKSGGSSEPFSCGAPSCCGGMCDMD